MGQNVKATAIVATNLDTIQICSVSQANPKQIVTMKIIVHQKTPRSFETSKKNRFFFLEKTRTPRINGCDVVTSFPYFGDPWIFHWSEAVQVKSIESKRMPLATIACSLWSNGSIPLGEETPGVKVLTASCVADRTWCFSEVNFLYLVIKCCKWM